MDFTKYNGLIPRATLIYIERLTDRGIYQLYTLSIDFDDDESFPVVEKLNTLFKEKSLLGPQSPEPSCSKLE